MQIRLSTSRSSPRTPSNSTSSTRGLRVEGPMPTPDELRASSRPAKADRRWHRAEHGRRELVTFYIQVDEVPGARHGREARRQDRDAGDGRSRWPTIALFTIPRETHRLVKACSRTRAVLRSPRPTAARAPTPGPDRARRTAVASGLADSVPRPCAATTWRRRRPRRPRCRWPIRRRTGPSVVASGTGDTSTGRWVASRGPDERRVGAHAAVDP